jgi:DNA-binding PadR family transcriptional regulator
MALKELDEILLLAVLCGGGRDVPFRRIVEAVEYRTGIELPRTAAGRALGRLARRGLISLAPGKGSPGSRRPRKRYSLEAAGVQHLKRVLGRLRAMSRGVRHELV